MTARYEVYKCDACGTIVEVLDPGIGTLVCCDEPMVLLAAHREDLGHEKHVPVIERDGEIVKVMVGSVPHPMEEDHFIKWIELIADNSVIREFLEPGQAPEAEFRTDAEKIGAREYCSIHGLWKS